MKKVSPRTFRKIIGVLIFLALSFAGGVYFSTNYELTIVDQARSAVTDTHQDLGDISMRNGIVSLKYVFENTTNQPLDLTNLYTSCMCTKAKLLTDKTATGYAGMQGHKSGLMPLDPNIVLEPGESAELLVEFDPNAHGPQGVGPMTRSIIIETDSKTQPQLQFTFAGVVTQ